MKFTKKQTDLGLGIFAEADIPTGEVIAAIRFVRQVTAQTPRTEGERFEHQIYLPNGQVFLVADPYCYFNHSCDPNAWLFSVGRQPFLMSKRDIGQGEEITVDYELSAVDEETWVNVCGGDPALRVPDSGLVGDEWECRCGARNCRGLHKWNFFTLPRETILKSLPYLDPWFVRVHEQRIRRILEGGE